MKKFFMLLLAGLMAVSVAACSTKPTEEKIYTAGTYTATAAGFGGDVTVTLTVSDTAITAVEIVGDAETAAIGGAALETLAAAIKDANSVEVDVVSGATVTSNAVLAAAKKACDQAMGVAPSKTALTDGTYTATAAGYSWTGMMTGEVKIENGAIASITITEEHDSDTGEIAKTALDLLPGRIVANQSLATDAISGATVTSNGIKDIVGQAIEMAGGKKTEWMDEVAKETDTVKLEGYDVVVVGLGGSGMLSYMAAADAGATVFGIETAAKLGGNSTTTTGPMLLGPIGDAYADVNFADKDEVYDVWIDYVGSEEKADIIKEAVYNNDTHIKYYVDNFDFEFAGMILSFVRPQWSQFWTSYVAENGVRNIFGPNKTNQYVRAMDKAVAMNEKNDYMLELTAEELIFDGETAVGVKAVAYDGTTYEVYGDSIILATGGYVGNAEMCEEHWGRTLNTVAQTTSDGTGINMGISAGGATYMLGVDPMIHIQQIPNMIKNDDLTADQKALLTNLDVLEAAKTAYAALSTPAPAAYQGAIIYEYGVTDSSKVPNALGYFNRVLLDGVQNGAEAVVPLERNRAWLSRVAEDLYDIQQEKGSYHNGIDPQLMALLNHISEQLDKLAELRIYLNSGALVGELAPAIDGRIADRYGHALRGNTR